MFTLKSTQELKEQKGDTQTLTHKHTKFNFHKNLFDCVDCIKLEFLLFFVNLSF